MQENNPETKHIARAVIPTKAEIFSLLGFSFAFLALGTAIDKFKSFDSVNFNIAADNIEANTRHILSYVDKLLNSNILTFLLWMFIGMIVYTLSWMAISALSAYRSDLPTTRGMVFPKGFRKTRAINQGIAKLSMRTVSGVLLAWWVYFLTTSIIPFTLTAFNESFNALGLKTILNTTVSTTILAVSIFISFALTRFMLLRSRVFE